MKSIIYGNPFKNQFKAYLKKKPDITPFTEVLNLLSNSLDLPNKYKEHYLKGKWKGYKECHLAPDWLLIYKTTDTEVFLVATGSHDDLF